MHFFLLLHLLSIMSFLSPDSTWRGGSGVTLLCSPPHRAFCVLEGSVAIVEVDLGM